MFPARMWPVVAVLMWSWTVWADAPRPAKPNVVLLLTDDLGWQDVTCYDIDEPSPMETPNMDALAKKGVMFWQAYAPSPVCAPSRAAILTGQHPARIGMTAVSGGGPPHFWRPEAGQTSPWNSGRMPLEATTLAEALKAEGYATGHSGKWHLAPQPREHGFDSSCQHRGVQGGMPNRLTGFATRAPNDPFRLDENGFPFDVPQDAALKFLEAKKDQPFFLYYATWLVHAPISMKSEQLLQKYVKKLGVELKPEHRDTWRQGGQTNPFYCAMVEQLDYYMGQIFRYLETTDDPRWPGHKLVENTYIILTSDNGGMENLPEHRFTENAPLANGKISTKEGGIRVPLIITGPGIAAGVQTDVMVNGLDFYPTILSLIGASKPKGAVFDGCDLTPLLTGDATNPALIRETDGRVRDTMVWHFPQMEGTSAIRVGEFKLRRSSGAGPRPLELYRLYRTENGKQVRVDIEEEHNLAAEMPEKANELEALRTKLVAEMGGRHGYYNPDWPGELAGKDTAPRIVSHQQTGRTLTVVYEDRGAKLAYADLIYTLVGGSGGHEEWMRADMTRKGDNQVVATIPEGATHYFVNLVDENSFLVVYPKIDAPALQEQKKPFSAVALFAGYPEPKAGTPLDFRARFQQLSRADAGATVVFHDNLEGATSTLMKMPQRGVAITAAPGGDGRFLKLTEVPGLQHEWQPSVGCDLQLPAGPRSGAIRVAFDVMLDSASPGCLSVALRDRSSGKSMMTGGDISVGNGVVCANKAPLRAIIPGEWYHIEITQDLRDGAAKSFTLTVQTADGRIASHTMPYSNRDFQALSTLAFSGLGSPGTTIYVDNIIGRLEQR